MPGRDSATSQTSNDNNAANIQGKHYGASTGSKNSLQISSGDQYNTGPIYNGAYNQNNGIQNSAESGGSISIDQQTLNQDPETGVNPAGPSGQGPFENAGAERPPAAAPFHDQYQTFASHPPYGYPGPHFGYLYSHDQLIPHPNSYPPPPYLHGYGACFCPNPHGPTTTTTRTAQGASP
ncbi:hypothetical protein BDN72DRAFT_956264 [Pluteus cervinus]|uniref:Uncharacterized protein n=1 Tax=Pluteus cervinus TaxID=181527 RepID=A0ACD3B7T6_9AGAR|nr:hypothetical protein BDN72DRAFT_956264 [Pluteus cervinus]